MRTILAGILAGLVAFVWSAVVHMNPVTAPMGLSMLNAKEPAMLAAIKANAPDPGLYFYPGMDMSKTMSKEEEAAWTAKFKAGPSGLLLVQPPGQEPMPPRMLIVEFVSTVLCGIIAACIVASSVGSFGCRVMKVASLGLFTWLAISVSQWNWYSFPFAFIAVDAIDQTIGWLLGGLVLAKMIKRPTAS